MKLTKSNWLLFYIISFLTFLGFYVGVLLVFNLGLNTSSRVVTIPLRLAIGFCLLVFFVKNIKRYKFNVNTYCFIIFAFLYLLRIGIDYNFAQDYYLTASDHFFFYLSFMVVPFLGISGFPLGGKYMEILMKALLYSGVAFSILAILIYRQFVGVVGRLSTQSADAEVISPLILSYCSALIIGVISTYLLYNKTSSTHKFIGITAIVLSVIPFFLGASRGALVALFIPILFIIVANRGVGNFLKTLIQGGVLLLGIIYLDESLESGLLNRFLDTSEAIETNSSSAVRLTIWQSSFNQFLQHPVFGDRLKVYNWDGYPHNIFLEVLQTTGILGFIPFIILIVNALKICFNIIRDFRQYIWLAVIFLQALLQYMFSGALYTAAWFWMAIALLFAFSNFRKINQNDY